MEMSHIARAYGLGSALLLTVACSDRGSPKPPAPPIPPAPVAPVAPAVQGGTAANPSAGTLSTSTSNQSIIEIAGLTMPKPATWTWQAPSMAFRTLQYSVPANASGTAGELVFSFFSSGDGGALDANIERWRQQFRSGDGSAAPFQREDREVNGLKVIVMEFAGAYQGMGAAAPRQGMAQLGAIVQAPSGTVFIRLIGPSATVESNRAGFEALVDGLKFAE